MKAVGKTAVAAKWGVLAVFLLIMNCDAYALERFIGGIGTGGVAIQEDGRFSTATVNGNPHAPIDDLPGAFAAIRVGGDASAQVMRLDEAESVAVSGTFPRVKVAYQDASVPVDVQLDALGHAVPHDLQASTVPGIVLQFRVTNRTAQTHDVALAMSWPNLAGFREDLVNLAGGNCLHEVQRSGRLAGVALRFEGESLPRLQRNANGEQGLFAERADGQQTWLLPSWRVENAEETFWPRLSNDSTPEETRQSIPWQEGPRPAAGVGLRQVLAPNQAATFTFYLTWVLPQHEDGQGAMRTPVIAERFSSVMDVARELSRHGAEYRQRLTQWQDDYRASNASNLMGESIFDGLAYLSRHGLLFEDNLLALAAINAERPGNLASPEELLIAYPMLLNSYPEWVMPLIRQYTAAQLNNGEVPSTVGNFDTRIGSGDIPGGFVGRPDSASALALLIYAHYLWTGDERILQEEGDNLTAALVWLYNSDTDANQAPNGPSLFGPESDSAVRAPTLSWAIAAMRAGDDVGTWIQDAEFATIARRIRGELVQAQNHFLWNGHYVMDAFGESETPFAESRRGLLPGIAFEQWVGWQTGLDAVKLRSHLHPKRIETVGGSVLDGLEAALWANAGLPEAAQSIINKQAQDSSRAYLRKAGLWWLWESLMGVGLNHHHETLILGHVSESNPPSQTVELNGMRGSLDVTWASRAGQWRYRFQCQEETGEVEAVQQVGVRFFSLQEAAGAVVRLLYNGEELEGQDFTRDTLRVFSLTRPVMLKEGDRLSLLVAPADGGRIRFDAAKGQAVNLGTQCAIEGIPGVERGMVFRVENLLHQPQIIFAEFAQRTGEENLVLFLNGQRIPWGAAGTTEVPLVLQSSALSEADARWLRRIDQACAETIRRLAMQEPLGAQSVNERLWELQKTVSAARNLDGIQRGFVLEWVPADQEEESQTEIENRGDERTLLELMQEAREQAAEFRSDISRLCPDPVLASQIMGDFAPLSVSVSKDEITPEQQDFRLQLDVSVEPNASVSYRSQVDLLDGWRAEARTPVQFEIRGSHTSESRTVIFDVSPAANLWQERVVLPAVITGAWGSTPFRREIELPIGHSFIREWKVIGPFPGRRGEGYTTQYPPELNIELTETYGGDDLERRWETYAAEDGWVDFRAALPQSERGGVGYAYVSIFSPRDQQVKWHFSASGDTKLFLNYKEIFARRHLHQTKPGGRVLEQSLMQGWNHLVVKINEQDGPWGFYFEITDMEGKPIPGLRYALDQA